MNKQMNPSIIRLITAFETEIEAQKASVKIGLKGADLMVQGLTDDLKEFCRANGIELCECCGEWSDDCEETDCHGSECRDCINESNSIIAAQEGAYRQAKGF